MSKQQPHITIITPCYNESITVVRFLESLEDVLETLSYSFCVVVVNDCSTDDTLPLLNSFQFKAGNINLRIIGLKCNVGHQAAIYQGFLYAQTLASAHFIVMDADGQDAPSAILNLLRHLDADIVNVIRSKRKESILFKLGYRAYKLLFKAITGTEMNFGNFSLISRNILDQAVCSGFSHFAAFLSKQKGSRRYIVVERRNRIGGRSKMGFKKLLNHAFMSFKEYWGSPEQDLSKSV